MSIQVDRFPSGVHVRTNAVGHHDTYVEIRVDLVNGTEDAALEALNKAYAEMRKRLEA